ncbi:MAG: FKBP-type peptidyl-prolyl cis-trans isomerase [Chitinophagaceae bacterium]|nr:FKBP-type peptidyl-prolyl cis-trans isomerase [Chitinophagaceae bacterium]
MTKKFICLVALFLIFIPANGQKEKGKSKSEKKLETLKDSASYAMGYSIGQTLSTKYPGMDIDLIAKGLNDAFGADTAILKPEAINGLVTTFVKHQARIQAMTNREAGEKFLKENATKDNVIKTESGLQYIILKQGYGEKPLEGNRVKVHYRGTLLNGREFESSYTSGQPEEFEIDRVIKGWTEALKLMAAGSKFRIFIPSELAYGENGMGNTIPPASTLIFELELLAVL